MKINNWSQLAYEIVETLACKTRLLTRRQLEHGWPQITAKELDETIDRLCRSGLALAAEWTFPRTPFTGMPIHHWSPSEPYPAIEEIAIQVGGRWRMKNDQQTVFAATQTAARLFGANGGGFPPQHHRNHDLLLSEVYVNYRRVAPKVAAMWVGEDEVPSAEIGVKNPDAFLVNENGEIVRVVESAGRYSGKQIESFHDYCEANQFAYELW